ncbi:MAG: tetratricopeptide repeat protein [Chthoniobacterales bacterium]
MRRLLLLLLLAAAPGCKPKPSSRPLVAPAPDISGLRELVQLHHRQQQWPEEEAALSQLLALEDTAADHVQRALVRRRLHRWPEAIEDVRRAQALQPEAPEVRAATKLFGQVGKFLTGIQDLDARLASAPEDDHLLADRALLLLRSGDPELALADGEAASKIAPWAMRPRLFAGLALIALDRKKEARATGINPQFQLDSLTPEALESISRLDAEISVERTNPEFYLSRAWQLNDLGQPALALEDAESALRFDPKSAGALAEIAYAESKLGRTDEAFAHIQQATELDPNLATAWNYRGELEMALGQFEPAIESLTRALTLNQTPDALEKRAECYARLGQTEKAAADRSTLAALR